MYSPANIRLIRGYNKRIRNSAAHELQPLVDRARSLMYRLRGIIKFKSVILHPIFEIKLCEKVCFFYPGRTEEDGETELRIMHGSNEVMNVLLHGKNTAEAGIVDRATDKHYEIMVELGDLLTLIKTECATYNIRNFVIEV